MSATEFQVRKPASAFRSTIAVSLVCLCAFTVLIGLGLWQLQRKAEKEAILVRMDSRLREAPVQLPTETEWPRWQPEQDEYRRVTLRGTFLHESESPVYGTFDTQRGDGAHGFYLLTPVRLTDGSIVFVERGFVPDRLSDRSTRSDALPTSEISIDGVMRAPQRRGFFTPADGTEKNLWFTRDPSAMAKAHNLTKVAPFYVQASSLDQPSGWPKPASIHPDLPNNHLQYALTWFGLAGALFSIYISFTLSKHIINLK